MKGSWLEWCAEVGGLRLFASLHCVPRCERQRQCRCLKLRVLEIRMPLLDPHASIWWARAGCLYLVGTYRPLFGGHADMGTQRCNSIGIRRALVARHLSHGQEIEAWHMGSMTCSHAPLTSHLHGLPIISHAPMLLIQYLICIL